MTLCCPASAAFANTLEDQRHPQSKAHCTRSSLPSTAARSTRPACLLSPFSKQEANWDTVDAGIRALVEDARSAPHAFCQPGFGGGGGEVGGGYG